MLAALAGQLALLSVLAGTGGLGPAGALVGLVSCAVALGLLLRGLRRSGAPGLGPADRVTTTRAVLVGGVAALVGESFVRPVPVGWLVPLAVVALVLDGVDGRVARRTRTVSALGARFDVEVDSFLVLVLSVYVARELGPWVVAVGSVSYALHVARWALPWLRRQAPPRHWCKVVAVVQAVVLTTAATGVPPTAVTVGALGVVAVLLGESFGREVWWLWRTHRAAPLGVVAAPAVGPAGA
ncbi:CDP-alcohol phosphatidyltransferase family protein [Geodermatophilus sp. SYSU D00691]